MKLTRIEERKVEEFIRRYKASQDGNHIDNSSLPAGSPMYYYCKACGTFITSLPEEHFSPAPQLCDACVDLKNLALLEEAKRKAK